MAMIGWVATHTGLPSLYVVGTATIRTGDRVLGTVKVGQALMVSDALAQPGVPTVYTAGPDTVTLTRRVDGARYVILTDATGRGIPGLWYRDLGDPESWQSDAVRYPDGGGRWSEHTPMRTGSGRFVGWDPAATGTMWDLVRAKSPVIVGVAAQVPGASPLRAVVIDKVGRTRLTPDGAQTWDVEWTEYPKEQLTGVAPVVTWAEWDAYGKAHPSTPGWQPVTQRDLAQVIAGMPL